MIHNSNTEKVKSFTDIEEHYSSCTEPPTPSEFHSKIDSSIWNDFESKYKLNGSTGTGVLNPEFCYTNVKDVYLHVTRHLQQPQQFCFQTESVKGSRGGWLYALFITRGKAELRVSGQTNLFARQTLAMMHIPPATSVTLHPRGTEGCSCVSLFISEGTIAAATDRFAIGDRRSMGLLTRTGAGVSSPRVIPFTPALKQYCSSLERRSQDDIATSAYLQIKLAELMCLISGQSDTAPDIPQSHVPYRTRQRLQKVKAMIDINLGRPLTIDEAAAATGLNRRSLSEGFRRMFGTSYKAYAITRRLEYAYKLLVQTAASVTEVAEACGYEYVGNFTRAFKRQFNRCPLEVRRDG